MKLSLLVFFLIPLMALVLADNHTHKEKWEAFKKKHGKIYKDTNHEEEK